ncbi:MAG: hypothetical protein CBB71_23295 [Rhodopirellula sp. TMED11]|nr:MAG: hypothetical protein CBB71_23295 [Rhodopirellula sp. TMED11]
MRSGFPVIETHTGGEITRVVFADGIGLPDLPAAQQVDHLKQNLDWVRRSLTCEPRGMQFAVGAVVTKLPDANRYRVLFFNNVGYLAMCGHGLIGVVEALRYQHLVDAGTRLCESARPAPLSGQVVFETAAGEVIAEVLPGGAVSFQGVPSFRYRTNVELQLEDGTPCVGDIAYGGNWFFLSSVERIEMSLCENLMQRTTMIRSALERDRITGADGAEIDHIELYGHQSFDVSVLADLDESLAGESLAAQGAGVDGLNPSGLHIEGAANFVLCPGHHYDRSPCGTGTSAKLACLAASGKLQPGGIWVQQSVTGSRFLGSYERLRDDRGQGDGLVRVTVVGRASVTAVSWQIYDAADPLRFGIGN